MKDRATLGIERETKERFEELKPYNTITHDEFIQVLMDTYEQGGQ